MKFFKKSYWHIIFITAYVLFSQKALAQTSPFPHIDALHRFGGGGILLIFCLMLGGIFLLYKKQRKLIREQANYKMLALSQETLAYQMDQHFTFNTLNSIQRIILENHPHLAVRYIAQLGKLIRNTLHHAKINQLSIDEEISSLELYLQMELLRTKDRFQYHIETRKELDRYNIEIPTGLIQPLVEQVIWWRFIPKKEKGQLRICFDHQLNFVICEIEDNGIAQGANSKENLSPLISKGMILFRQRVETLNMKSKDVIELSYLDSKESTERSQNLIRLKIPILRYQ